MSVEAEEACRSIMRICADWEIVSRRIDQADMRNRVAISNSDSLTAEQSAQTLSYISRMVAECEYFTFGRIRDMASAHVEAAGSPMLTKLYEKNKSTIDSTWPNALAFAKDSLGVDLRRLSEWSSFQHLITLRNASAHGRGEFTEKQLKNPQEVKKMLQGLSDFGYSFDGHRIVAYRGSVRDSSRDCRSFALAVDAATRNLPR
ncbi:hypothetical protein ACFYO0_35475 [Streptomyces sp. NPDC006365]|uniref:hypothetical protein n=1 Tax=Streptomyces sp. NPDC006365 TaxID=3364744 RepID=UPI0036AC44F6